ncbi:Acetyl-CoA:oxalate CoA-transferase [compost metagenome]
MLDVVQMPELAQDPRFATTSDRAANQEDLKTLLEARFAGAGVAHWIAAFHAAGVPHARINDYAAALADPQVAHMAWVRPLSLPGGTQTRTFASPLRFDGMGLPIRRDPPALGQHNAHVRARYQDPDIVHATSREAS